MTDDVLPKLEHAFVIDATVDEACAYSKIAESTFYKWQRNNPLFSEWIAELRLKPVLKARQTIINALSRPEHARWYLERKRKVEFGPKQEIEHTGTIKAESRPIAGLDEIKRRYEAEVVTYLSITP
jgi:hypothetical protein